MTRRHAAAAVLVAVLAPLAAAPSGAARAAVSSGLTGTVTRGPTMPVCRVGEPCSAPAAGFVLVFVRTAGAATVRTRTDAAGRYRVALPAGTYVVSGSPRPVIGRGIAPARVHVRPGHVDRIDFDVDTGIR